MKIARRAVTSLAAGDGRNRRIIAMKGQATEENADVVFRRRFHVPQFPGRRLHGVHARLIVLAAHHSL
jgi:hypothetical protein